MERTCGICQSVTYDDEESICSVCGAELAQANDDVEVEEVQETSDSSEPAEPGIELDLGDLELDEPDAEETSEAPITPVRVDEPEIDELELDDAQEADEEPAEEEPPQTDDSWDTGAVGGEAGIDVEMDEEEGQPDDPPSEDEVEEIEIGEDELLCPDCKEIVKTGSEACPNCNTGTEYLVPCPACAIGIDKLAEICPHCYTDLNMLKEQQEEEPPEEASESAEPEPEVPATVSEETETSDQPEEIEVTEEPDSVQAAELGQNGELSEKEKKKMLKKLMKEQKDLEKQLKKGEITEDEFTKRLDEIRMGNGFGPIGGYVLEEAEGKSLEDVEMGQNGDLSEKDKKKMLKKLQKEQKELEKQLDKGEITEDEFTERLDKIRLGNGFGPIGGYVLEEAEDQEAEARMSQSEIADKKVDRAARRELIKEELAKERSQGFFNYYNLSLITLFFFVFLALFVLMEFIFTIGNFTTQADVPTAIFFDFTPTIDEITSVPILLFGVLLTMSSAVLHIWDRKMNLMLSFIPSGIMVFALVIDTVFMPANMISVSIVVILILLILMITLDLYCTFIAYPVVLNAQSRDELEMYLEKEEEKREIQQSLEDEYQKMIEEEEEKLKMKDDEIDHIKTELESLGEQIEQEEEKLRMKESEISSIRSELDLKTQQMAEEEEKLRMKEDEMESLISTELEKRADDMMLEEQEKLRMKEEELIKATNELDIQKNLFDDTREKLRMKEQQMQSIKSELENQMRQRMEEQDRLRLKEAAAKMLDRGKQKRVLFPFAAMVGQQKMKRALTLNAVYSEIGGVLIRGQKGTGKSVSVRGLAEVLPDIEVTGCKFNCDPADTDKFCTECKATHKAGKLEIHKRPVQVVDLPLNITEDRLVGSIDIERILAAGEKSFEPGILAEAHRGILYVDEINLLDDYIVDILLDAASSGVVTIEREGMSISHPSKFIIVGSMNPEEGELRPQILDRLALQCDVIGIKDVEQRIQIVKRREAFTSDPIAFREQYESNRTELREKVNKARELIPNVSTPPRIYKLIAQICLDFDVDGHRADIIIERAARANAAFEGRLETTAEDIVSAAAMALPHRMKRRPSEDEEFNEESLMKLVKSREAELEG